MCLQRCRKAAGVGSAPKVNLPRTNYTYLRCELAARLGMTQKAAHALLRVSFAKVAEYQQRGFTTLSTKTRASERRIALPTRCIQPLKLHREQQREREAAGTTWRHSGHVFTTPHGGTIDPTNLARASPRSSARPVSAASDSSISAIRPPLCSLSRVANSS